MSRFSRGMHLDDRDRDPRNDLRNRDNRGGFNQRNEYNNQSSSRSVDHTPRYLDYNTGNPLQHQTLPPHRVEVERERNYSEPQFLNQQPQILWGDTENITIPRENDISSTNNDLITLSNLLNSGILSNLITPPPPLINIPISMSMYHHQSSQLHAPPSSITSHQVRVEEYVPPPVIDDYKVTSSNIFNVNNRVWKDNNVHHTVNNNNNNNNNENRRAAPFLNNEFTINNNDEYINNKIEIKKNVFPTESWRGVGGGERKDTMGGIDYIDERRNNERLPQRSIFLGGGRGRGGFMKGPCFEFKQRGECKYGTSCKFTHEAAVGNNVIYSNNKVNNNEWGGYRGDAKKVSKTSSSTYYKDDKADLIKSEERKFTNSFFKSKKEEEDDAPEEGEIISNDEEGVNVFVSGEMKIVEENKELMNLNPPLPKNGGGDVGGMVGATVDDLAYKGKKRSRSPLVEGYNEEKPSKLQKVGQKKQEVIVIDDDEDFLYNSKEKEISPPLLVSIPSFSPMRTFHSPSRPFHSPSFISEKRKLPLILDLDHTLIHATADIRVTQLLDNMMKSSRRNTDATYVSHLNRIMDGLFQITIEKKNSRPVPMWIKIRPGVHDFLANVSQFFQLFIYTQGEETYANLIMKHLDLDGSYFGGRIIARPDSAAGVLVNSNNVAKKTFSEVLKMIKSDHLKLPSITKSNNVLPTLDDLMKSSIICDDRVDVWTMATDEKPTVGDDGVAILSGSSEQNLIQMSPYYFFQGCARNAEETPNTALSFGNSDVEVSNEASYVSDIALAITDVHNKMWKDSTVQNIKGRIIEIPSLDVRHAIQAVRFSTLQGCVIVFSGVIPLGTNPSESKLWVECEKFGAKCVNEVTSDVTHVVASRMGTAKTQSATKHSSINIVHVDWLHQSILRWARQLEKNYLFSS